MINIAVIGTSNITEQFLNVLKDIPEVNFYAVYSRDKNKGLAFAKKFGSSICYDSLEDLGEDNNIKAIYIASPNSSHCEQALCLMNAGKHILVEKAIASNSHEFLKMQEAAVRNKVILMEEMRSIHDPGFAYVKEKISELGEIRQAIFQFCQYSSRYDNFKKGIIENAFKPELSNGALMDIGIYCVHFLAALFGMPEVIKADAVILKNSIDGAGSILAKYGDNMLAQLNYSKITKSEVPSQIMGEKGVMLIDKIADPRKIQIIYNNGEDKTVEIDKVPHNMYYAIKNFAKAVMNGESVQQYQTYSYQEMLITDEARRQMGIAFPADYAK